MLNEVDIDFRILGLPHSVVKHAEKNRVRELVKKIENHRHRQSLQRDLQQNKAYNPFSTTSKKMIQDMGNVELFELFETDRRRSAKNAFHSMYSRLSLNSKLRDQEVTTSWPQIRENSPTKEYHQEKEMHQEAF